MAFYLRVEDLAPACIGPFPSKESALRHYEWCKRKGDGAALKSITERAPTPEDHKHGIVLTEQEDINMPR